MAPQEPPEPAGLDESMLGQWAQRVGPCPPVTAERVGVADEIDGHRLVGLTGWVSAGIART